MFKRLLCTLGGTKVTDKQISYSMFDNNTYTIRVKRNIAPRSAGTRRRRSDIFIDYTFTFRTSKKYDVDVMESEKNIFSSILKKIKKKITNNENVDKILLPFLFEDVIQCDNVIFLIQF